MTVEEAAPDVRQAARRAVRGPDERGKDGPMAKVGAELALLYHQHRENGARGVQVLREASTQPPVEARAATQRRTTPSEAQASAYSPISPDGEYVTVHAVPSTRPTALLGDLQALGLENGATAGTLVSGRLPVSAIEEAAGLSSLRGMMPAYARLRAGSVDSEADTAHRALDARMDFGVDGGGQKICALSDSYDQDDQAATSAADDVRSGDLPGEENPEGNTTPVDVLQDDATLLNTDEGRAMLQLIHDIAPGAELGFHTALDGLGDFTSGIRELADAGCTVIVDDIGFSTEPFYQDGPVSNAVDDVVNNDGAAYFSSAGNDGQNSYEAPFRNSGRSGVIDTSAVLHDFDPGSAVDPRQEITINVGGNFGFFSFQWTDPSSIVEGSEGANTDIDVALVNDTLGVVAQSTADNIQTGVPVESLDFTNNGNIDTDGDGVADSTFHLVIEKVAGPDPDEVKYIYSGSDFTIEEFDTLGPTVFGHPMAEGAMATAAAAFFNTAALNDDVDAAAVLNDFSSLGGIPILFDQNGDRLATPEQRQKPEVTGADGIDNTFFGADLPDAFEDPDPHPNFFGTSAAAPNVAAVAGLVREADPSLSPTAVYDRLESTASDVTRRLTREEGLTVAGPNDGEAIAEGGDDWSGAGFVRADRAIPSDGANDPPTAADDEFSTDANTELVSEAPGVLENDSDPDGDALSVSVVDGDEGAVGLERTLDSGALLTVNEDGSVVYDPNGQFDGLSDGETATETFTYTATDGNGGSDQATVTITVNGVDEPPTIVTNEGLTLAQGARASITTNELRASDAESGPSELTYTLQAGPQNGDLLVGGTEASDFTQADLEEGRVEYTHTASTAEDDSFDFEVSDSAGNTTRGTFDIAVVATQISADPGQLDFGTVAIRRDSTQSFGVIGEGGVDIDVDSVTAGAPYEVTSGAAGFTLSEGDTTEVAVTYGPENETPPGEVDEAVAKVFHDASEPESPLEVDLSGTAEAPQIAVDPSVLSDTTRSGREEELVAEITNEASEVASLTVQVTGIPDFLSLARVDAPEGSFNASDVELQLGPQESAMLNYRFAEEIEEKTVFRDSIVHQTNDPDASVLELPVEVVVEPGEFAVSTSREFPDASDPANYELVGLPGRVDVDLARTVSGEQGPNWRGFREIGAQGEGEAGLREYDGSDAFNFRPGRAFWVIAQDEWAFEDTVQSVDSTMIALQDGWNAISNPLREDLSWAVLQRANGIQEALWRWDGEWTQADTLASARDGGGFYFFNGAGLETLDLTAAPRAETVLANRPDQEEESSAPWTIGLRAVADGKQSRVVTAGIGEEASSYRAPPIHFGKKPVSLYLQKGESKNAYARVMKRASGDKAKEFDLRVEAKPNSAVTIVVDERTDQNTSTDAVLVEENGRSHSLRNSSVTRIPTGEEGDVALTLHVGTERQVQRIATPEETALRGNYPNPFSGETTLELSLSEKADVKIQVYNVLGQRIATIKDENMQAGIHRVKWAPRSLPSGTYFVRMEATGTTDTQQVTVVR